MTTFPRAYGWLPDHPGARYFGVKEAFGAPLTALLPSADHTPFRGARLYQRGASACVAFAMNRSRDTYNRTNGYEDAPDGAPGFDYWNARREALAWQARTVGDDLENLPLPEDVGCRPIDMVTAVSGLGYVPEASYPFSDDPAYLRQQPPGTLYEDAYAQSGLVAARHAELGSARLDVVVQAMRQRIPVMCGITMGEEFANLADDTPLDAMGPAIASHMVTVAEVWQPIVQGFPALERLVRLDNWWEGWGADGYGVVTERLFCSDRFSNLTFIQHVPPTRRA